MWAFLLWKIMSERLTTAWTPDLIGAFGNNPTVIMGREGELTVLKEVASWKEFEVLDHEQDKEKQLQGIDISIKKSNWSRFYTVDVKTGRSYLDEYGTIKINATKDGWLFNKNKTSDRIWHVNLNTKWMAWYDRKQMQEFVRGETGILENNAEESHCIISNKARLSFITRGKFK